MGTWGPGNFQNDSVGDWINELVEADDPAYLVRELEEVHRAAPPVDDIFDHAEEACGAAEVLLAAFGRPAPDLDFMAREWLERRRPSYDPKVVKLAQRAIRRVAQDYETRYINPETPQFQQR